MATKRICSTIVHPKPFTIPSDGGREVYSTTPETLHADGFCTCPGYQYRGTCKHLIRVNTIMRCRWMAQNDEEEKLEICPVCGESTIEFNTEPEIL